MARDWVLGPMTRPRRGGRLDRRRHRVSQEGSALGRTWPASTAAPLGKQDNCQVAVSVSLANDAVSLSGRVSPVPAGELGAGSAAPPDCGGAGRRGVPAQVAARPEPRSGRCRPRGCRRAPIVADAGYGDTTEFRDALRAAGLVYVVGIKGETTVWRPGPTPWPPSHGGGGRGRPSIRVRRTARHQPGEPQESWPSNCPPRRGRS